MSYKVAFDNLVKFLGRDTLSIKEVTAQFLKDWGQVDNGTAQRVGRLRAEQLS